jgi:hypothetical protein
VLAALGGLREALENGAVGEGEDCVRGGEGRGGQGGPFGGDVGAADASCATGDVRVGLGRRRRWCFLRLDCGGAGVSSTSGRLFRRGYLLLRRLSGAAAGSSWCVSLAGV